MNLFNIFKNKKEEPSKAKEDFEKASKLFEEGNYQEALRTLSNGFQKDVDYKPLYQLSANCLDQMEGQEEAQLFRQALNNFDAFDSFNNLGKHFFEVNHYNMAIPFLEKAVNIYSKNDDTTHDLAIVYARRFQIEKAIETLEINDPKSNFWNYWFWLKLKILAGKIDGVGEGLQQLTNSLDQEANQDEVVFAREKVNEAKEILSRFQLIQNPKKHIQDWHFIQYGGAILDFFFEEEDNYVAGGRYVASWGSHNGIKGILYRLNIYLEKLDVTIEQVRYITDKDSEIIGRAVGKELNIKTSAYNAQEENHNCLIVAANSNAFDNHPELSNINNGQITFALDHSWLNASYVTPDIIGFMNQMYSFPWNGGGYKFDPETGTSERTEPDLRSEEIIATEIFQEEVSSDVDLKNLEFYLTHKNHLKGIGSQAGNQRFNFMIESPVPGSFFG